MHPMVPLQVWWLVNWFYDLLLTSYRCLTGFLILHIGLFICWHWILAAINLTIPGLITFLYCLYFNSENTDLKCHFHIGTECNLQFSRHLLARLGDSTYPVFILLSLNLKQRCTQLNSRNPRYAHAEIRTQVVVICSPTRFQYAWTSYQI